MGRLERNAKTYSHSRYTTAPYKLSTKLKEKQDSTEIGTDYEHQKAKDYLTRQYKNSKELSTTKMTASKHSCKVLHQYNPLFLVEGDQETKTGQKRSW
jgi:hypothetical protein